jgi:transcriptional regulator with XRE-family HTH domain
MKRTRKWQFIGQEAQRLASLGMSLTDIGRKLDVRQSTVSRWVSSGKLTRPSAADRAKAGAAAAAKRQPKFQTPEQWADSVRKDYALDATDEQLVISGQEALEIARNQAETPATRMTASGRFQAIVKQLALGLSDRKVAETTEPERLAPRRVPTRTPGVDPRQILSAVS